MATARPAMASFELDVSTRTLRWTGDAEYLFGGDAPKRLGALLRHLDPIARRQWRHAVRQALATDTPAETTVTVQLGQRTWAFSVRSAIEPQYDGTVHGLVFAEVIERPGRVRALEAPDGHDGHDGLPRRRSPEMTAITDPVEAVSTALKATFDHDGFRLRSDLEFIVDIVDELPLGPGQQGPSVHRAIEALVDDGLAHVDAGWFHLYVTHDAATEQLVVGSEDSGDELDVAAARALEQRLHCALDASSSEVQVLVETPEPGGRRCEIALPWPATRDPDDARDARDARDIGDTGDIDVLVVSDRPRTADVLAQRLAEAGLRCTVLHDVVAATRAIATRTQLDAVITTTWVAGVLCDELVGCWAHARPDLVFATATGPAASANRGASSAETLSLPFPWTAASVAHLITSRVAKRRDRTQPERRSVDVQAAPAA